MKNKMDIGTNARLNNEILQQISKIAPVEGCINITIKNNKTGEEKYTQLDKNIYETWFDFSKTLYDEMEELDMGELKDLSIESMEYAGTDNMCSRD